MTPEERQAEALARWLSGPRDAPPPDDLDPEIVEAILCLQTERIPGPRVTADEILASVTEGPLATAPVAGGTGAEDTIGDTPRLAAAAVAPDLMPEPANTPMDPRRSPWLRVAFGGGAVAVLSAAAILLVVLPALRSQAPEPAPAASEVAAAPTPSAPAPNTPPPTAEPADAPAAELGAVAARPRSTSSAGEEIVRTGSVGTASGRGGPAGPSGGDALGALEGSNAADGRERLAQSAPAPKPSAGSLPDEDAVADLDDAMVEEREAAPTAGSAAADSAPIERSTGARAAASESQELAKADVIEDRARDRKETRTRADAAPPASAPPAEPDVAPPPPPTSEVSARPRGPISAPAIEPKRMLDEGQAARALPLCDARFAVSGRTATERADLLWVKGLALWRLGRTADAEVAFVEASRLR